MRPVARTARLTLLSPIQKVIQQPLLYLPESYWFDIQWDVAEFEDFNFGEFATS